MKRWVLFGSSLVILAVCLGCATVPTVVPQALADARSALTAARRVQAERLVPVDFQEAERLLKQTETAFAGEQKIEIIEELAFAARMHAEIAEARARTWQAEEACKVEQQKLSDGNILLSALDHKAKEMREAKLKMKRVEAERVAAQARAAAVASKTEADAQLHRELQSILEKTRKIKNTRAEIENLTLTITLAGKDLFADGSSQLHRGARKTLEAVAGLLAEYPQYHARVEGYTDNTGEYLDNNMLSNGRAESVTNYLTQQGISLDRLKVIGMGSKHPIAPNTHAAGRRLNHRVEVVMEKKTETTPSP